MFVKHLQEYLDKFTEGPQAEALGPCSSKLVERNIYLYRGSCITELVAQGLKLEPCCLGLEACASFLSKLGA
jgi:hypothetical protein